MARDATVVVHVELPPGLAAAPGAVTVRVEDVSRADAAAVVAGEARLAGGTAAAELRAAVRVAAVDERAAYAVRVHVDADGDGAVSDGDLLSTQHYPVLTRGHPDLVRVRVQRV